VEVTGTKPEISPVI